MLNEGLRIASSDLPHVRMDLYILASRLSRFNDGAFPWGGSIIGTGHAMGFICCASKRPVGQNILPKFETRVHLVEARPGLDRRGPTLAKLCAKISRPSAKLARAGDGPSRAKIGRAPSYLVNGASKLANFVLHLREVRRFKQPQ